MPADNEFRHVNVGTATEVERTEEVFNDPEPATDDELFERDILRPHYRGDCPESMPCPFVGCRYHLASDEVRGSPRLAPGFILIDRNCALHFVDDNPGGATLEKVGEEFLLTRERVRQIERRALAKLRSARIYADIADIVAG
jgi:hypothetical protein